MQLHHTAWHGDARQRSYQGNPVYNSVREQAGIDLPGRRQVGVPSNQRLLVVFRLAVPGEPDLPQPSHPCFAHLRHAATSASPRSPPLSPQGSNSQSTSRRQCSLVLCIMLVCLMPELQAGQVLWDHVVPRCCFTQGYPRDYWFSNMAGADSLVWPALEQGAQKYEQW